MSYGRSASTFSLTFVTEPSSLFSLSIIDSTPRATRFARSETCVWSREQGCVRLSERRGAAFFPGREKRERTASTAPVTAPVTTLTIPGAAPTTVFTTEVALFAALFPIAIAAPVTDVRPSIAIPRALAAPSIASFSTSETSDTTLTIQPPTPLTKSLNHPRVCMSSWRATASASVALRTPEEEEATPWEEEVEVAEDSAPSSLHHQAPAASASAAALSDAPSSGAGTSPIDGEEASPASPSAPSADSASARPRRLLFFTTAANTEGSCLSWRIWSTSLRLALTIPLTGPKLKPPPLPKVGRGSDEEDTPLVLLLPLLLVLLLVPLLEEEEEDAAESEEDEVLLVEELPLVVALLLGDDGGFGGGRGGCGGRGGRGPCGGGCGLPLPSGGTPGRTHSQLSSPPPLCVCRGCIVRPSGGGRRSVRGMPFGARGGSRSPSEETLSASCQVPLLSTSPSLPPPALAVRLRLSAACSTDMSVALIFSMRSTANGSAALNASPHGAARIRRIN